MEGLDDEAAVTSHHSRRTLYLRSFHVALGILGQSPAGSQIDYGERPKTLPGSPMTVSNMTSTEDCRQLPAQKAALSEGICRLFINPRSHKGRYVCAPKSQA